MFTLLRWGLVSTSPNPQVEGPPFVGCPRPLIQYIRRYPPYLEAVPPSATWGCAMPLWQGPTYHCDPLITVTWTHLSLWQEPTYHGVKIQVKNFTKIVHVVFLAGKSTDRLMDGRTWRNNRLILAALRTHLKRVWNSGQKRTVGTVTLFSEQGQIFCTVSTPAIVVKARCGRAEMHLYTGKECFAYPLA